MCYNTEIKNKLPSGRGYSGELYPRGFSVSLGVDERMNLKQPGRQ
jgi:hypothetical protein